MQPPEGPPVCAALNLPARNAAADVEHDLAQRRPHRHLDQARVRDLAGQREHLRALAARGADGANQSAPRAMIAGMLANVSTLLISVGLPHRPDSGGYGGRGRGCPRLPSIEAISAVSSPHTNAPAPMRRSMRNWNPLLQDAAAQQPLALRLLDGGLQPLDRQPILAADVDIALLRADGVPGDGHPFQHAVRIAFQHAAVHERARVAFVRVAHHVLHRRGLLGDQFPLEAGRIARAAASAQPALLDLLHVSFGVISLIALASAW